MDIDKSYLAEKIIRELATAGKTLATAESCTGGLIGHLLTNVPGSSDCYKGGVIVYSNLLKKNLLGVPENILRNYGAVSKETVEKMCVGLKKLIGADYGIAVSGIAGPGGGTVEKPVGLVYIGIAGESEPYVIEYRFKGSRKEIKWETAYTALSELERVRD